MANQTNLFEDGEIIRAKDTTGFIPEAVYQVEYEDNGMVHLSAGEMIAGTRAANLIVLERGLKAPATWTETEVLVLKQNVKRCGCRECRRFLREKQKQLEAEIVH